VLGVSSTLAEWIFGIRMAPELQLGRRVRIWHSGGIRLNVRSIGDDVHLRPNTTCDPEPGWANDLNRWPAIGHRADIGAGVRLLGGVSVGDDTLVGANTLVLEDVPATSSMLGVPGRVLPKRPAVRRGPAPAPAAPRVWGVENQNPKDIGLFALIGEDF